MTFSVGPQIKKPDFAAASIAPPLLFCQLLRATLSAPGRQLLYKPQPWPCTLIHTSTVSAFALMLSSIPVPQTHIHMAVLASNFVGESQDFSATLHRASWLLVNFLIVGGVATTRRMVAFQNLVWGLVCNELDRLGAKRAQEHKVGVSLVRRPRTTVRRILTVL
jgi:hypothetical protein